MSGQNLWQKLAVLIFTFNKWQENLHFKGSHWNVFDNFQTKKGLGGQH